MLKADAVQQFAYPRLVLEGAAKRLVEGVAGRGGLEAVLQFIDQVDWVDGLTELRQTIKPITTFFEAAISKCSKEMLKRPLKMRKRQLTEFMGSMCPKCGLFATFWLMSDFEGSCPKCGTPLKPMIEVAVEKLVQERIELSPERMLMYVAYDMLAEAYVAAYKALGMVLPEIGKILGFRNYRVDRRVLEYIEAYFYGRMAGEQKIAREEKEALQFLVRGNLAGIPFEKAEQLLRLAIQIVKYGYLYQVLDASGALYHYQLAVEKYNPLYNELNRQIRLALNMMVEEEKTRRVRIKKFQTGYYAPCMIIPRSCWISGELSSEIVLEPVFRLPVFPKSDLGAIQAVFGPVGSGKTVLLSSIICYSILAKNHAVLIPLNDRNNSYSLASIPAFPYSEGTQKMMRLLEIMEVEPRGVPCITVSVLRKGEAVDSVQRHPPTIYDRVLEVDNPVNFAVDFDELFRELKDVAEGYGYSRPVGIIAFRNLLRSDEKRYIDVEAASNVLNEFDKWRKGNMGFPMRVVIDEISYMAASHAVKYATDKLFAGATVGDFIKESRRNAVALDAATQVPIEILPAIRNEATNIFFRKLAMSKDKTRSPIDFLLDSIQLKDDMLKPVIRDMNNRGVLPKHFWFWYNRESYSVDVIRPNPPTFCTFDPDAKKTPMEILQRYERLTGQRILLESWDKVKRLKPASKTQGKRYALMDYRI